MHLWSSECGAHVIRGMGGRETFEWHVVVGSLVLATTTDLSGDHCESVVFHQRVCSVRFTVLVDCGVTVGHMKYCSDIQ